MYMLIYVHVRICILIHVHSLYEVGTSYAEKGSHIITKGVFPTSAVTNHRLSLLTVVHVIGLP